MSETIIKVEGLGKKYLIGHQRKDSYKTLREQVEHSLKNVFFKTKQMLKGGEVLEGDEVEEFWALQDINFEVKKGDRIGIIGRNGAGKSTLLKILSRITEPTTGRIYIKGRIASLLEVGTGFHPELTGRENVFLNGAILGMNRTEIKRKFDEIVDFSGVTRYIDTPVKRYSSGMYVRLAFAVAAHLESEILVVDEVLAVGDAEFQKKCLGKMEDDTNKLGRTILFVSHNMTAMNSLCGTILYLRDGRIIRKGGTTEVINYYLSSGNELTTKRVWDDSNFPGDDIVRLKQARLISNTGDDLDALDFYEGGGIEYTYEVLKEGFLPVPNMHLFNQKGDHVFASSETSSDMLKEMGIYKTIMWIPGNYLNDGRYIAGIASSTMRPEKIHFYEQDAIIFDVIEDMNLRNNEYRGPIPGVIRPNLKWDTIRIK